MGKISEKICFSQTSYAKCTIFQEIFGGTVSRQGKAGLVEYGWNIKIRRSGRRQNPGIRKCIGSWDVTVQSGMTMCAAASVAGGMVRPLSMGAAAAWFLFSADSHGGKTNREVSTNLNQEV